MSNTQESENQNIGWGSYLWSKGTSLFSYFLPAPTANDLDPNNAASRFVQEFERSYGETHPNFLCTSFQQACNKSKSDFQFLVVYLHSNLHEHTPSFCKDTLCTNVVAEFINEHFLCWAGSISMSESFKVSNMLGASTYPYIAILCNNPGVGSNSNMTLLDKIEGPIDSEDLLSRLTNVLENQGPLLTAARVDAEEREADRRIREEQDQAFLQSLAEDEEKERRAREEQRRIQEEQEALEREEREREQMELDRARRRESLAQQLPPEPAVDEAGIATLAIRLSDGSRVTRRFRGSDKLQIVYDFVDTKQTQIDNYDLVSNFPRKVFDDHNITVQQAGLLPQAALFVQEK